MTVEHDCQDGKCASKAWTLIRMTEAHRFTLQKPDTSFERTYLEGLRTLTSHSDRLAWVYMGDDADLTFPERDFRSYVEALLGRESEAAPGFVRDTVFWAILEGQMIGRIALRHELNDFLRRAGGHIGYIVFPSWRGKGVATEMLRQVLLTDRAKSIGKLLVTCDEGNLASEKTILRNEGIFEKMVEVAPGQPLKKRFWIDLRA